MHRHERDIPFFEEGQMIKYLHRRFEPLLIQREIGRGGTNHVEDLLSFEYVIPNGGAAEINVKIGEAVGDSHQTILFNGRSAGWNKWRLNEWRLKV